MLGLLLGSHWVRLLMENVLPFIGSGPLSVPSLGFHPGDWLLLMAPCRFAYPAGGSFLLSTERNQRAPQGLCPWESYQGVPPGPLSGPREALVAHRLVKSFPAQTASQMLGIHKVFLALCSLLDGKIPVHTVPPENSPRPRMGQTPHTLLSLRGYWKIPCGGIPPPATPTGPPPSGGGLGACH